MRAKETNSRPESITAIDEGDPISFALARAAEIAFCAIS
jgi:hypothetical protein